MNAREYGLAVTTGTWQQKPPAVDDVAGILYIVVGPFSVVVMLRSGQGYNFRGAPEYLAGLKSLAQSLGKGHALPGRNQVLAYGQIGVLLGKHSKVA
jgi:hypothetical protein